MNIEQITNEKEGQLSLDIAPVKTENQRIMEAVLFTVPAAVSVQELAKACGISTAEANNEIRGLAEIYDREDGGLLIKELNGAYRMCTNPKYFENLVQFVTTAKKPELSEVLMETLAIIANKGKATRIEIEKIRGVKSDFGVNKLIEYGLVEEAGRLNVPGKPMLFAPTEEFYRRFGVENTAAMPKVGPDMESRISDEVEIDVREIFGEETENAENSKV